MATPARGGSKTPLKNGSQTQNGKRKRTEQPEPTTHPNIRAKRNLETPNAPSDPGRSSFERAKSIFRGDDDPYCPSSITAPKALPESEEWSFRFDVLCTTDPNHTIFKRALQGILQMSFPSGFVSDEISDIERKMREKGANEKRVDSMRKLAGEEVIHRLIWVLAEYLDTPDKARETITSIVDASNHRHGQKNEENGFGSLAKELRKLRGQTLGDRAGRVDAEGSTQLPIRSRSPERPPTRPRTSIIIPENQYKRRPSIQEEIVSSSAQTHSLQNRKKACWDIETPLDLSKEDIPKIFKKDRHLYAYHALPVVREDMEDNTPYEDLTAEIRRRWKGLTEKERKSWILSYKRLLSGDSSMLVFSKDSSSPPAPSDGEAGVPSERGNNAHNGRKDVKIKREPNIDANSSTLRSTASIIKQDGTTKSHSNASTDATRGSVVVNVPLSASRKSVTVNPHADVPRGPASERLQNTEPPVVDLFWGTSELPRDQPEDVTRALLPWLSQRIPEETASISFPDKICYRMTKASVRPRTMKALTSTYLVDSKKARSDIERDLQYWIAVNPKAFPELWQHPVMFSVLRMDTTPVTDLLFLNGPALTPATAIAVGDFVCNAFRNRMHPMNYEVEFGARSKIRDSIFSVLRDCAGSSLGFRLEMRVRPIVFRYRDRFLELKQCDLVQEWEAISGLKW
ncbi:hypothetical protein BU16DRAFT_558051 [Lophium mytilinum]|uniref:Uncharacterized protein n=1 Tax=Lophium mytilinum TaxID=390894 RepID=A0A6A6R7N0_9PEZI|nr:hypothetical protein BU16DRAFT_558051 [Lophium mytilinum]